MSELREQLERTLGDAYSIEKELGGGGMFATPVTTGAHFTNGTPRLLFTAPGYSMGANHRNYDVHPDGTRFLMVESGGADATHLEMILNWRVELEKLKAGSK